jgi:hypothetical protein
VGSDENYDDSNAPNPRDSDMNILEDGAGRIFAQLVEWIAQETLSTLSSKRHARIILIVF